MLAALVQAVAQVLRFGLGEGAGVPLGGQLGLVLALQPLQLGPQVALLGPRNASRAATSPVLALAAVALSGGDGAFRRNPAASRSSTGITSRAPYPAPLRAVRRPRGGAGWSYGSRRMRRRPRAGSAGDGCSWPRILPCPHRSPPPRHRHRCRRRPGHTRGRHRRGLDGVTLPWPAGSRRPHGEGLRPRRHILTMLRYRHLAHNAAPALDLRGGSRPVFPGAAPARGSSPLTLSALWAGARERGRRPGRAARRDARSSVRRPGRWGDARRRAGRGARTAARCPPCGRDRPASVRRPAAAVGHPPDTGGPAGTTPSHLCRV